MPPRSSRKRISRKLISAKASSQTKMASRTRTGTSARPQCAASVSSQSITLQDLQRSKPFGLAIVAVVEAGCGADGENHGEAQRDGEVEVELSADVGINVVAPVLVVGRHHAGEHGGADVAQIECGGADLSEADRGQVHFAGDPGEAARGDLVDCEAGEALHLAVALLAPVIDIIVAERTEIISGERAVALAADRPRVGVQPD